MKPLALLDGTESVAFFAAVRSRRDVVLTSNDRKWAETIQAKDGP